MSEEVVNAQLDTIIDIIQNYEESYERPLYFQRKFLSWAISGVWMAANAGIAFYAYNEWEASGRQLTLGSLYERGLTLFEKRLGKAYLFASALMLYRDTIVELYYLVLARDRQLESHYRDVVGYLAEYLNAVPEHFDFRLETQYLHRPIYAEAMHFNKRIDYFGRTGDSTSLLDSTFAKD